MALGDAVGGLMWPSWYSSTGRVSEEVGIGLLAFLMAWSWFNTPQLYAFSSPEILGMLL